MSDLVWVPDSKPDRPGIWQMKGAHHPYWVEEPEHFGMPVSTWAFICDLPDIKDPPKYRDVAPADVGREVECSDNGKTWNKFLLAAIKPLDMSHPYVCRVPSYHRIAISFVFARILDDGQPAKQPREWWFWRGHGDAHWHRSEHAVNSSDQIHVREVID